MAFCRQKRPRWWKAELACQRNKLRLLHLSCPLPPKCHVHFYFCTFTLFSYLKYSLLFLPLSRNDHFEDLSEVSPFLRCCPLKFNFSATFPFFLNSVIQHILTTLAEQHYILEILSCIWKSPYSYLEFFVFPSIPTTNILHIVHHHVVSKVQ